MRIFHSLSVGFLWHRRRNRRLRLIRKYLRILAKEREAIRQLNDYQKSLISILHSFAGSIINSTTTNYGHSEQYSVEHLPSLRWKLLSRGYLVYPAVVSLEGVGPRKPEKEPAELAIEPRTFSQSAR